MSANPSLRRAIRELERLGCTVTIAKGTGEYLVVAPNGTMVRANSRRKDTPRPIAILLKRMEADREQTPAAVRQADPRRRD